jgi:putative PIN family toxin of toxin-antitoxin system
VRFVLDTNVLVSGLIAAGPPRRLVDGAIAGEFELCMSEVLLAELLDVLSRENFVTRLSQAGLTPQGIVDDLRRLAVVVSPTDVPRVVPTDPDDERRSQHPQNRAEQAGRMAPPLLAGRHAAFDCLSNDFPTACPSQCIQRMIHLQAHADMIREILEEIK